MAQEREMAVPTMWKLINLLASIEPKQQANGHRRDACAPLPKSKSNLLLVLLVLPKSIDACIVKFSNQL